MLSLCVAMLVSTFSILANTCPMLCSIPFVFFPIFYAFRCRCNTSQLFVTYLQCCFDDFPCCCLKLFLSIPSNAFQCSIVLQRVWICSQSFPMCLLYLLIRFYTCPRCFVAFAILFIWIGSNKPPIASPTISINLVAGSDNFPKSIRVCLEVGFESEKSQFFDETRHLFEERTQRYGQKK